VEVQAYVAHSTAPGFVAGAVSGTGTSAGARPGEDDNDEDIEIVDAPPDPEDVRMVLEGPITVTADSTPATNNLDVDVDVDLDASSPVSSGSPVREVVSGPNSPVSGNGPTISSA